MKTARTEKHTWRGKNTNAVSEMMQTRPRREERDGGGGRATADSERDDERSKDERAR